MPVFIFIFFCLAAQKNFASDQNTAQDKETFWQMVGRDLASPVTTPANKVLVPGAIVTTFLWADKEHVDVPFQNQTVKDQPLGSTSKYGDDLGQLLPNAIYVLGFGSYGYFAKDDLAMERAILMFKASLYSGVVADAIKPIAHEERPSNSNYQAFPSGHATSAFSFAAVVGAEHGWAWGVPAYAMATFVGYSRINDNQHWLHDVVAGATIGTSYGLGVYYRSLATGEHPGAKAGKFAIVPVVTGDTYGLNLFAEM